jgi:ribonucleoside-diphosphate reductase alpha chain
MKVKKIIKNETVKNYFTNSILSVDCAEIAMGGGDSCRLIALNMFNCVDNPFTNDSSFNYDKWYETCYIGQRLNDDLVDLELDSIETILKKIDDDIEPDYIKDVERRTWSKLYEMGKRGRRTGLGITALGDVLAALNLKYDTDEAVDMTEKIMKVKCEAEFQSSIDMGIQRGIFDGFNPEIENTSEFVKMLQIELPHVYERMMKHGRRNVSISTVAPTGSLSILCRTTSGIEPLFMIEPYERRKKVFGDEPHDFVDDLGDKWITYKVYHPKLKMFLDINEDKDIGDSFYINAEDIDWSKRVDIQSVCQKYTTHSISSTINLKSDVTEDVVSNIYMDAWEKGLKGITVYRDGSRSGVLIKNENKNESNINSDILFYKDSNAPKRPKILSTDVVKFVNKGEKWIGFVGIIEDDKGNYRPYEIFTGLQDSFMVPYYVEKGEIIKTKIDGVSRYDFVYKDKDGYPIIMTGLNRSFNREFWNLGKMISAILRHRMPLKNVVDLIDSLKFTEDHISTWKSGVKRIIKRYIKDDEEYNSLDVCPSCGSTRYIYEGGCEICKDCGFSRKC